MEGQEKIFRIIDFILTLNSNIGFKKETIREKLSISDSTFRRYIDNLEAIGFRVIKDKGHYYRIDPECSMLKTITSAVLFSDKQKEILAKSISYSNIIEEEKTDLISKISIICDSDPIIYSFIQYDELMITKKLREAISNQKQVVLKEYQSANSSSFMDRTIEPFKFINGFRSLWAFDIEKKANRVFKIARITDLKECDSEWQFRTKHKAKKSDIFGMTGDSFTTVELKLNLRAKLLMEEEIYLASNYIKTLDDGSFLFSAQIASFEGIARFIMGLPDCVEVLSPTELQCLVK